MNKALAYVRVSTVRQVREGDSLAAQEERLHAYCKAHNLELVGVVKDEGVSGVMPLAQRPGGSQLLVQLGPEIPTVVVVKFDRMFRDTRDALNTIADMDERGIKLHALDFGGMALDTSTALGKLIVTLRAGFAQMERDLTRERVIENIVYKKSKQQKLGQIPFGHTAKGDQLIRHPRLPAALTHIEEMHEAGRSLRDIAHDVAKTFRHPCFKVSHQTIRKIIQIQTTGDIA